MISVGHAFKRLQIDSENSGPLLCSFYGSSDSEEYACNAGDPSSIPGSGGSPGEENGNPLQYSCLENPVDRGAWRATVHGVAESDTAEQPNAFTFLCSTSSV